jgi:cytochrome c biogenesis protein CcdA
MKKINIISGLLLVYLVVMSVIGWPGKDAEPDYVRYFLVMGATLVVILLLRFLQIRRFKLREKWKKEKEK